MQRSLRFVFGQAPSYFSYRALPKAGSRSPCEKAKGHMRDGEPKGRLSEFNCPSWDQSGGYARLFEYTAGAKRDVTHDCH